MIVKSVLGIIFHEENVLLIKRRDVPVWVFPGGGIEEGETGEKAIVREVKEETGLDVEVTRRIGTYTGGFFVKPVHLYDCRVVSGTVCAGEEALASKFFPLNKLPKEIPPPFEEFLEDALRYSPPFERKITSITISRIVITVLQHPIFFIRFILSRLGIHINAS